MATNFANTLKGLILISIEEVWNAVVNTLWGAISKAAGAALPKP